MKKLLILFWAASFIAACNNENPFAKKSKADKEESTGEKKKEDNGYDDPDDGGKKYTTGSWSKAQREDWRSKCMNEYSDEPNAKQICSCILEKMEKKFPDEKDAMDATEEETSSLVAGCEKLARGGDGSNNDGGNTGLYRENNNNANWTDLQRQTFIQGCATEAQRVQGFTLQQATTYCDCMTRKVESKYSFEQAARLTAADFQTQEWANAAANCRSRIY